MKLDVLVFAAHPDDAEIGMGGTIAKLTGSGLKVGVIDLSQGELSTRGNVETRKKEASKAAEILKLSVRGNLNLPDGQLNPAQENIKAVVTQIRKYKPGIIFSLYKNDRHPDHIGVSKIVKDAWFLSGVQKYETKENGKLQPPFRPGKIFYYMLAYRFEPTFIVDMSNTFETKMKSIKAYKTQVFDPESGEPNTFISDPKFIKYLEARSRFYGFQIKKDYGEPFYSEESIELELVGMLKKR